MAGLGVGGRFMTPGEFQAARRAPAASAKGKQYRGDLARAGQRARANQKRLTRGHTANDYQAKVMALARARRKGGPGAGLVQPMRGDTSNFLRQVNRMGTRGAPAAGGRGFMSMPSRKPLPQDPWPSLRDEAGLNAAPAMPGGTPQALQDLARMNATLAARNRSGFYSKQRRGMYQQPGGAGATAPTPSAGAKGPQMGAVGHSQYKNIPGYGRVLQPMETLSEQGKVDTSPVEVETPDPAASQVTRQPGGAFTGRWRDPLTNQPIPVGGPLARGRRGPRFWGGLLSPGQHAGMPPVGAGSARPQAPQQLPPPNIDDPTNRPPATPLADELLGQPPQPQGPPVPPGQPVPRSRSPQQPPTVDGRQPTPNSGPMGNPQGIPPRQPGAPPNLPGGVAMTQPPMSGFSARRNAFGGGGPKLAALTQNLRKQAIAKHAQEPMLDDLWRGRPTAGPKVGDIDPQSGRPFQPIPPGTVGPPSGPGPWILPNEGPTIADLMRGEETPELPYGPLVDPLPHPDPGIGVPWGGDIPFSPLWKGVQPADMDPGFSIGGQGPDMDPGFSIGGRTTTPLQQGNAGSEVPGGAGLTAPKPDMGANAGGMTKKFNYSMFGGRSGAAPLEEPVVDKLQAGGKKMKGIAGESKAQHTAKVEMLNKAAIDEVGKESPFVAGFLANLYKQGFTEKAALAAVTKAIASNEVIAEEFQKLAVKKTKFTRWFGRAGDAVEAAGEAARRTGKVVADPPAAPTMGPVRPDPKSKTLSGHTTTGSNLQLKGGLETVTPPPPSATPTARAPLRQPEPENLTEMFDEHLRSQGQLPPLEEGFGAGIPKPPEQPSLAPEGIRRTMAETSPLDVAKGTTPAPSARAAGPAPPPEDFGKGLFRETTHPTPGTPTKPIVGREGLITPTQAAVGAGTVGAGATGAALLNQGQEPAPAPTAGPPPMPKPVDPTEGAVAATQPTGAPGEPVTSTFGGDFDFSYDNMATYADIVQGEGGQSWLVPKAERMPELVAVMDEWNKNESVARQSLFERKAAIDQQALALGVRTEGEHAYSYGKQNTWPRAGLNPTPEQQAAVDKWHAERNAHFAESQAHLGEIHKIGNASALVQTYKKGLTKQEHEMKVQKGLENANAGQIDQEDTELINDAPATEEVRKRALEKSGDPATAEKDVEEFMFGLTGAEFALVAGGIALGAIGLISVISGEEGMMPIAMTIAGLGAAGVGGYAAWDRGAFGHRQPGDAAATGQTAEGDAAAKPGWLSRMYSNVGDFASDLGDVAAFNLPEGDIRNWALNAGLSDEKRTQLQPIALTAKTMGVPAAKKMVEMAYANDPKIYEGYTPEQVMMVIEAMAAQEVPPATAKP